MKFVIKDESKINEFIEITKLMKNLSDTITMMCYEEHVHIQLLDGSQVCLLDINIPRIWFDEYVCDEPHTFSVNASVICKLFGLFTKGSVMESEVDDEKYRLSYLNEHDNTYFVINLMDIEKDLLTPIINETNLDFSIKTSILDTYLNDLSIFGEDVSVMCDNDMLFLSTEGDTGSMKVEIKVDTLDSFDVIDDYTFSCKYSTKYLQYITKLKKNYKTVHLYLDESNPLLITFENEETSIKINYFIAPKVNED